MISRGLGLFIGWLVVGCSSGPRADSTGEPDPDPPTSADSTPEAPPCTVACEVERIYSGDHPSMLALDRTHVYFVQGSTLQRIPRRGGEPEPMLEDAAWYSPLAHGDQVFTCRKAPNLEVEVVRLPSDGAPPLATAAACKLAALGDHLYFPTRDVHWNHWLARVPIAGGEVERLERLGRTLAELASDETHVYFTTESGDLRRFDPATRTVEVLLEGRVGMMELALTDTHVVWLELSNLVRVAKHQRGGEPERVANFQDVLDFASDGAQLYWASVSDEAWRRLGPDATLVTHRVDAGASSIVVDGTRVWWTEFADAGGIFTLDTCGCSDDVLVPSPTIRAIQGPDVEDPVRLGYASGDELDIQVNDLSSDEHAALTLLELADDGSVPVGAEGLPPRFRIGDRFRVATSKGVFDATLTGFELGGGGSGLLFYLKLDAPGAGDGVALLGKPDGPELTALREATPSPRDPARYLPAVREAARAAGLDRKRIKAEHLTVVRGKFPAPHVAIIAVEAPGLASEDEPADYLSALLLGDASGALTGVIYPPAARIDAFTIDFLVDIGADAIDEVGFSSAYYEGSYDHLLRWSDATPQVVTLAGDGA